MGGAAGRLGGFGEGADELVAVAGFDLGECCLSAFLELAPSTGKSLLLVVSLKTLEVGEGFDDLGFLMGQWLSTFIMEAMEGVADARCAVVVVFGLAAALVVAVVVVVAEEDLVALPVERGIGSNGGCRRMVLAGGGAADFLDRELVSVSESVSSIISAWGGIGCLW